MLPEKTYNAVYEGLRAAADAMSAHGNDELIKDEDDIAIHKRLLQLGQRVTKQGKKAQKVGIRSGQQ